MGLNPISEIKANLGIEPKGKVHKFFTAACQRRMDKYVPKDVGNLREIISLKEDSITYQSNYAHAQYVGFTKGPVRHYTTPGTGPKWDEKMVSAEGQQLLKEVQDYVRRQK